MTDLQSLQDRVVRLLKEKASTIMFKGLVLKRRSQQYPVEVNSNPLVSLRYICVDCGFSSNTLQDLEVHNCSAQKMRNV